MRTDVRSRALMVFGGAVFAAVVAMVGFQAAGDARGLDQRGAAPLKPLTDAASLARGKAVFEGMDGLCQSCHRPDLGGLVGPNLTDDYWASGCSVNDIIAATQKGFPDRGMMPFGAGKPLTTEQLHQVASYILSKRGSNPPNPKAFDPAREKVCK